MKKGKKILSLLLALMLCLGLFACGSKGDDDSPDDPDDPVGEDWRVTGVVQDAGTITRNGEDTFVLVCVYKNEVAFFHDSPDQVMFDFAEYPAPLTGDPAAMFQNIDFADRNEDDNSDVALILNDGADTILMVWFWNPESNAFEFQPEESQLSGAGEAAE